MIDNLTAMTARPNDPNPTQSRGTRGGEDNRAGTTRRTGDVERAYFCRACKGSP